MRENLPKPKSTGTGSRRRVVGEQGDRQLDLAALLLLRDLGCVRTGSEIDAPTLLAAWARTGLRGKDLADALARLSVAARVLIAASDAPARIRLLPAGEQRVRSLPVGIGAEVQIRYHLCDIEAGNRRDGRSREAGRRRRRSDRNPPATDAAPTPHATTAGSGRTNDAEGRG